MSIVFLGLGSNLGRRKENILEAIDRLRKDGVSILSRATIIETDPVGGPVQGKYLNTVVKVETTLEAPELHRLTRSIEKRMGRKNTVRDGPRVIDIDILLYDDIKMETKHLIIPHPRMLEREFVMKPLKEIAPTIAQNLSHENH